MEERHSLIVVGAKDGTGSSPNVKEYIAEAEESRLKNECDEEYEEARIKKRLQGHTYIMKSGPQRWPRWRQAFVGYCEFVHQKKQDMAE